MVWFWVNSMLPRCAVHPVGGSERGEGLCGGRAQPVTGRRGGYTVAAGRTVLAASPASFDCLVLCSAFHGAQLQGLVPDSLPDPVTCLPLLPGQVEVASQSSCRGTMGGAESGEEEPGLQAGGHTAPGWQPLGPHGQGQPHIPGPPQCLASCITPITLHPNRRACRAASRICPIQCCIPGAEDKVWHIVGAHSIPVE